MILQIKFKQFQQDITSLSTIIITIHNYHYIRVPIIICW